MICQNHLIKYCLVLLIHMVLIASATTLVQKEQARQSAAITASHILPDAQLTSIESLRGFKDEPSAFNAVLRSPDGRELSLLVSADTRRCPVISYTYGTDPEQVVIPHLLEIAKKHLSNPVHQQIYFLGFGEFWHEFRDDGRSVFINRRPPMQILDDEQFKVCKGQLLSKWEMSIPRDRVEIARQWQLFHAGVVLEPSTDHFIPHYQDTPDIAWHYGCAPTAAADVLGYYDHVYGWGTLFRYYFGELDTAAPGGGIDKTVPDIMVLLRDYMGTDENGSTPVTLDRGDKIIDAVNDQDGELDWDRDIADVYMGPEGFSKIKDEVDDGYPSIISVDLPGADGGHAMPVLGYREMNSSKLIYVLTTWGDARFWNIDDLTFWALTRIHPSLNPRGHGVRLTNLTGGETLQSNRSNTITWTTDSPGTGTISIFINTDGGTGAWTSIVDNVDNTGNWDWFTPSDYDGEKCRLRIRWWASDLVGEDGSQEGFRVVSGTMPDMTDGTTLYRTWPFQYSITPGDNHWGVAAIETERIKVNNTLELYTDTGFGNLVTSDQMTLFRRWAMCGINLGPPNPPPGPFGVRVTTDGDGYIQYMDSKELGLGFNSSENWSSLHVLKAYHFYIEPASLMATSTTTVELRCLNSSLDFVIALFDDSKRFLDYSDALVIADDGEAGDDEELTIPEGQSGRFLLVLWEKAGETGSFYLILDNETEANSQAHLVLNKPDTLDFSNTLAVMPLGSSPWHVAGLIPDKGSRWRIEADHRRDFAGTPVSSDLEKPFVNLVVIRKPPAETDSVFMRFTRVTGAGRSHVEIDDLQQPPALTEGTQAPLMWPARHAFQIVPIVTEEPLGNVVVRAFTKDGKNLNCGIAPDGKMGFFTTSMLWGEKAAIPPAALKVHQGVVVLWCPEPPKMPFEYEITTELKTGIRAEKVPDDYILDVRPNPFCDRLVIQTGNWKAGAGIEMFDLLGRRVDLTALHISQNTGQWIIETNPLPAGIYYLRLQGENIKPVRVVKIR